MTTYVSDEQLLQDLKNYINKNGIPKNLSKDFRVKNGLCSWETYENHLGGKLWDWISMCEIQLSDDELFELQHRGVRNTLTKEECIAIILDMQSNLDRPLMYDDFRGSGKNHIGITQIIKYWGTVNKMKEELGLTIIQDSMTDKAISSKDEFEQLCVDYVEYLLKNNITSIVTKDMDDKNGFPNYFAFNKYSEKYFGVQITEYLETNFGISFGRRGMGKVFHFNDGETTLSSFEYKFSNFLRDNGFKYNKDYFRNVNYKDIDSLYEGYMNCDYKLIIKEQVVYVELAGVLGDKPHQLAYKNNTPINSKSKEEYRQKLNQKREIFERNGLEYYILLPDEMNEDTYRKILNKYLCETT